MSKKQNKLIGQIGENLAKNFLVDKGHHIIEQNFRTKFGEIDLITQDHDILVFVEVKTKVGDDFGPPEEMFTRGKYRRVKNMATVYLKGTEVPSRIDVIAIVLDDTHRPISIHHYPNLYF